MKPEIKKEIAVLLIILVLFMISSGYFHSITKKSEQQITQGDKQEETVDTISNKTIKTDMTYPEDALKGSDQGCGDESENVSEIKTKEVAAENGQSPMLHEKIRDYCQGYDYRIDLTYEADGLEFYFDHMNVAKTYRKRGYDIKVYYSVKNNTKEDRGFEFEIPDINNRTGYLYYNNEQYSLAGQLASEFTNGAGLAPGEEIEGKMDLWIVESLNKDCNMQELYTDDSFIMGLNYNIRTGDATNSWYLKWKLENGIVSDVLE